MSNPAATTTPDTITRAEWDRTHPDYRTGSPSAGTAKVLRLENGVTCLVPVAVVR